MKIGIIGCGNMGGGIARSLAKQYSLFLYDHNLSRSKKLALELNSNACTTLKELNICDLIILAIKPQQLKSFSEEFNPHEKQLIVSILAGISISSLKQLFPQCAIARTMSNLAAIYGEGVVIIAEDNSFSNKVRSALEKICSNLGSVYWFPEEKIDALTALMGSGPAFIYVIIEAMIDAAVEMGIDAAQAKEIIIQMLFGSATLLRETGEDPAKLRAQIASPGGTTIAGIRAMEEAGIRSGIIKTFLATYQRAVELSRVDRMD